MKPTEWYKNFLTRRGLSLPSSEPLYSYKLSEGDLATLKDAVTVHATSAPDWDCCFVLYATEWWRTSYEGGHWSWEPIVKSIDKSGLSTAERNRLVASGLKKWRRPVNESLRGNDYIGTIVLECGLPLRVLESEHYLGEVITDLYRELGAISSFEAKHLELIRSIPSTRRLPQTLQNDAFLLLLAKFVTTLVQINVKYGFTSADNPVQRLDELDDQWRLQFPLRVDEEIARQFIDGLLKGVADAQEWRADLIRIRHELSRNDTGFKLVTRLDIKGGICKPQLLGIPEADFAGLANKLEIYLGTSTRESRIGFAFKKDNPDGFLVDDIRGELLPGPSPAHWEVYLLDTKTYRKLPLVPAGQDLSEIAEPLIFSASDNDGVEKGWELVATGSARLVHGAYRVMCPEHAVLQSGEWRLLGHTTIDEKEYAIYEIDTDVVIGQNESSFYLNFSAQAENFSYEVAPSMNGFEFCREENKAIHRGWPKIYKVRTDGVVIGQVSLGLEYLNGSTWSQLTRKEVGTVKIRLTDGPRVLFCKTIQVLPVDMTVEFNAHAGAVELARSRDLSVVVYGAIKTEVNPTKDGHSIFFLGEKQVLPKLFEIGLIPKNIQTDKIVLKIPCPGQQLHFSFAGRELRHRAPLFLHNLYGARLYINNLSPSSKTYRLKLKLVTEDVHDDLSVFQWIRVPAYGNVGLALVSLKDILVFLLSMTTNIDARVLVSCDGVAVEIGYFEFEFERLDGGYIHTKDSRTVKRPEDIRAFRLDQVFKPERISALARQPGGNRWRVPEMDGVWFIYPAGGGGAQFRPISYSLVRGMARGLSHGKKITRLHQSAVLRSSERMVAMDRVLDTMAIECGHPDWKELCELYEVLQHLPLSSHDAFTRLGYHPLAILTAAFVLPEGLVLRLSQEFAIIWARYPVDSWRLAFRHYHAHLTSVTSGSPLARRIANQEMNKRLEWIGRHLGLTSVAWIVGRLLSGEEHGVTLAESNARVVRHLIKEYLNGDERKPGLRARHHGEKKWPEQLGNLLVPLFNTLPEAVTELLDTTIASDQRCVVYLPFVLAEASVQHRHIKLPRLTPLINFRLREIIAFDEEWFTKAYNLLQGFLLINDKKLWLTSISIH